MQQTEFAPFRFSLEYLFTALSAWLIPGAGHWVLGYRVRAILHGAVILGLFWTGQALAIRPPNPHYPRGPIAVSRKVSPIFFACQAGCGFSAILSDALWGAPQYPDVATAGLDRYMPRQLNLAVLFTSVSGLLNYLLVLHILDPRTWIEAAAARSRDAALKPPNPVHPPTEGS